jgi:mannosylglycerate hydrolase
MGGEGVRRKSEQAMKPKIHIVSYTHWDREFRWEFEHTRMKLVECLDHLFEIMEADPGFKSFQLDGQVVLLDDYLEIRPEMEETVRRHVAEGRLEIGPWYTLPDCATPHGESIVRNLQFGVKRSLAYGDVLKCGYNVFSFGQIAQLPQLCAHFGIDMIIFYKFMNPARSRYPEFIWKSPDGTEAYASRLGPEARWNYFFAGHVPIVYGRDPWHADWK